MTPTPRWIFRVFRGCAALSVLLERLWTVSSRVLYCSSTIGGNVFSPFWDLLAQDHVASVKGATYFEKAHYEMNNHAINIVRAIKAAKTTSRLNLRIRLSYACVQPISPPLAVVRPQAIRLSSSIVFPYGSGEPGSGRLYLAEGTASVEITGSLAGDQISG